MSTRRPSPGAVATLAAISYAAFAIADVAHEALGHGGMCVLLGGHIHLISTTYEDCSIRSWLIDGAGPVAEIIVALLAAAWLRFAPPRGQGERLFLLLLFVFAIFWNVGYMIKSGLFDQGDWAFVIAGLRPSPAWHIGLTVLGVVLYAAAMRQTRWLITERLDGGTEHGVRPFPFTLIAYFAAGLLSVVAALSDPRGPTTIVTDALPSSLASIGLIWVGFMLGRRLPDFQVSMPVSLSWTAAGALVALLFVAALGPGMRF